MRIGSLKAGGGDGTLVVVSRDLSRAACIPGIVNTVQDLLDRWEECSERVAEAYTLLNYNEFPDAFPLLPEKLAAPLPRARGRCVAVRHSGEERMYHSAPDGFLGPRDDILVADERRDMACEPEMAVVTGEVRIGASVEEAARSIRLVMLGSTLTLRELAAAELQSGFAFFHAKPVTSFAPVAVTPDELGLASEEPGAKLPVMVEVNGTATTRPAMTSGDFPALVAQAARIRPLVAGTIVGAVAAGGQGETEPALSVGDHVRIEMLGRDKRSIFGAIEQKIARR